MPSFDTYSTDDRLRLLLQGPPGSGKSTLAFQFPKPWFFDLDHNLGGPVRFAREHGLPLPVGYDVVDRDDEGKPIERRLQFKRMVERAQALNNDPNVETFVYDSGTIVVDLLIEEVLRQQGKTAVSDYKDGRQFWNFFAVAAKQFMGALTNTRKHIVFTIHEKQNKDTNGAVVYPVRNTWPGQTGEMLGLWFTDVWRAQTKNEGNKVKYVLATTPSYQYALKNSLGLPAEFEFDWKLIESKLKGPLK